MEEIEQEGSRWGSPHSIITPHNSLIGCLKRELSRWVGTYCKSRLVKCQCITECGSRVCFTFRECVSHRLCMSIERKESTRQTRQGEVEGKWKKTHSLASVSVSPRQKRSLMGWGRENQYRNKAMLIHGSQWRQKHPGHANLTSSKGTYLHEETLKLGAGCRRYIRGSKNKWSNELCSLKLSAIFLR